LHHDPNDAEDTMALAEFVQISQQVEHDKEMRATYWDILKKPSWRKRAILVLFLL
jgi:plasmid replication initiation protein